MLIAVGFMPINIALEMQLYEYVSLLASGPIGKILSVIILYAILFSLEDLIHYHINSFLSRLLVNVNLLYAHNLNRPILLYL